MDFVTLQTEVAQQTGLDTTDTTTLTNIKRWINITQQDIVGRWPWEFLKAREVVQTVADKTAGTISVSSGGTSVTGVSTAFAAGDVGSFIQFSGSNDWYKITVVGGTTSLTIEAPYAGTTNLSGATYIIRKFFYSLSSTADAIIDVRNWNTPIKLVEIDASTVDAVRPNPQSVGSTSSFIGFGYDASGNIVISPYPFPNDVRNLEIRTLKRATDLSGDSDTSIIPGKWHHIITFGANALAYAFLRKLDISKLWKEEYEAKLGDMVRKERISEDDTPVLKPIDQTVRSPFLRMPDGFAILR